MKKSNRRGITFAKEIVWFMQESVLFQWTFSELFYIFSSCCNPRVKWSREKWMSIQWHSRNGLSNTVAHKHIGQLKPKNYVKLKIKFMNSSISFIWSYFKCWRAAYDEWLHLHRKSSSLQEILVGNAVLDYWWTSPPTTYLMCSRNVPSYDLLFTIDCLKTL